MKRFAFAAVVLLFVAADAQAQWGRWGYPQSYSAYSVYDQDRIPYFALHPPVYYSRPVPRTYGYSPFAYPGWMVTPDVDPAGDPLTIVNPYFSAPMDDVQAAPPGDAKPTPAPPKQQSVPPIKKSNTVKEVGDRQAAVTEPQPLRIMNPYVGRLARFAQ